MAANLKLDSNSTGLRVARQDSVSALPATPVWYPVNPNSYSDFGGEIKTVARQPINDSRQREKGVVVDLDASFGIQEDFTIKSLQRFIEGVLCADFIRRGDFDVSAVTSTGYTVAANGDTVLTGDLVYASGFTTAANNGLKSITVNGTSTEIKASGLTAGSETGTVVKVGRSFPSADISIDFNGDGRYKLLSASGAFLDPEFALETGEWICVGASPAGSRFATAAANGLYRVESITADEMILWAPNKTFAADAGTGKAIAIIYGRSVKNKRGADIKKIYYQAERTLGYLDNADTYPQKEYVIGSLIDTFKLTLNTADKVTYDLSFMATDHETSDGSTAPKSGTRPADELSDAFNTTSHLIGFYISIVNSSVPLFGYATDGTFEINNNVKPDKALSVLGAFDHTLGLLAASATVTAYFTDVAAVAAVRANEDVTIQAMFYKDGVGMVIDYPLGSLGDARARVALNEPIMLPLGYDAGRGGKLSSDLDHTACFTFFDYLPSWLEA